MTTFLEQLAEVQHEAGITRSKPAHVVARERSAEIGQTEFLNEARKVFDWYAGGRFSEAEMSAAVADEVRAMRADGREVEPTLNGAQTLAEATFQRLQRASDGSARMMAGQ